MSSIQFLRTTVFFLTGLYFMGCASVEPVSDIGHVPEASEMSIERYEQAASFLSWNLSSKLYRSSVIPFWLDNHRFWYRVDTPEGQFFYLVDASETSKQPAFDHERLAEAITIRSDIDITSRRLPFRFFNYSEDMGEITFRFRGQSWSCDIIRYECPEPEDLPQQVPNSVNSPNGQYAAFIKDYNLWIHVYDSGEDIQLTDDGEEYYGYAPNSQGWTRGDNPILLWSPDSKRIATFQQDERGVGKMPLVEMREGRPGFEYWPYVLPGDETVPMLERVIIDVENRELVRLGVEPSHQRTSNCCGLTRGQNWADVEWSDNGDHLSFVSTSRDYSTVTLYTANPNTGEVTEIHSETDEPFFESNLTSRGIPNWRVLHDSNEFIWFTRSDNWGHLFLHDLETGKMKNRITEGEWNVIDIVHINKEDRTILFTATGREEGRDPYFEHLYEVNFDGSGLRLLTEETGNHQVNISADGSYFTTTWSQPQNAQVTNLKDRNGNTILDLEEADTGELDEIGFRPPEPFRVKARDGETDIYGLMIKPSDFDPDKQYPIVNSIYPGPQTGSVGTRSFSMNRRGQAHALAELGFIVVLIDALGTPFRSKDFHTHWYGEMSDNGLEDQVIAMQQLADQRDYIDLERVGIYGHSGGGYATAAAMFQYPEFFKVGVSSAGNHDNRGYTYYWGEKYQGLREQDSSGDSYRNQAIHRNAENLEGKLLISYGTMDSNVHPNMTLQVVDALIHHNKDFDLMVFPNRGHGYANEAYHLRMTWDYFVRHLLGKEPPAGFRL
jgi:dipeptidyl-peptidase 4